MKNLIGPVLFCFVFLSETSNFVVEAQNVSDQVVEEHLAYGNTFPEQAKVKVAARTKDWNGFRIFVWQYKTDARHDLKLFRDLGLQAWHIDRGESQRIAVEFATKNNPPCYVDLLAGKGMLHLTDRSELANSERQALVRFRKDESIDQITCRDIQRESIRTL